MRYSRYLENKTRMTIQGKRYRVGNPNHPFHHIYNLEGHEGVYKAMGLTCTAEIANNIKRNVEAMFDEVVQGDVYVIRNMAWENWYKVGKAVSAESRLKDYQTSSPFRDYVLCYSEHFDDRHAAESSIHRLLEKHPQCLDRKGEWFKTYVPVIQEVMNEYRNQTTDTGHRDEQCPQHDLALCNTGC